jgi:hypothetical protein
MTYQNYIDLGFKRTDINDPVEFRETGYGGFFLHKKLNKKQSIEVCYPELDKPKLYIRKRDKETYHIVNISVEAVEDLVGKVQEVNWNLAC